MQLPYQRRSRPSCRYSPTPLNSASICQLPSPAVQPETAALSGHSPRANTQEIPSNFSPSPPLPLQHQHLHGRQPQPGSPLAPSTTNPHSDQITTLLSTRTWCQPTASAPRPSPTEDQQWVRIKTELLSQHPCMLADPVTGVLTPQPHKHRRGYLTRQTPHPPASGPLHLPLQQCAPFLVTQVTSTHSWNLSQPVAAFPDHIKDPYSTFSQHHRLFKANLSSEDLISFYLSHDNHLIKIKILLLKTVVPTPIQRASHILETQIFLI